MPIQGLGDCGICGKLLQDPTTGTSGPVRHFKGHQLAHKGCFDSWNADDERRYRAVETVGRLSGQIAAMQGDLKAAQQIIEEIDSKKAASNTN